MEKKEKDVSQILVDYGVYNQSGINAMKLDKELRNLLDKAREEGILVGIFGRDDRTREEKVADLKYLLSMCEMSRKEYEKALSKLKQ